MRNQESNTHDYCVVGSGDVTGIDCGKVKFSVKCPEHGDGYVVYNNCSHSLCPECYHFWISKACKRIVPRLNALYGDYLIDSDTNSTVLSHYQKISKFPYRHWVISVPISEIEKYNDPYECLKYLKQKTGLYGVAVYHPKRISQFGKEVISELRQKGAKGGNWEILHECNLVDSNDITYYSPHFHLITCGYISPMVEYHLRKKGYIVKLVRDVGKTMDKVEPVLRYLLTHAAALPDRNMSYRFFGLKHGVRLIEQVYYTKPEAELCPKCGRPMHLFNGGNDEGIYLISRKYYVYSFDFTRVKRKKENTYAKHKHLLTEFMKEIRKKEAEIQHNKDIHICLEVYGL